MKVYLLYSTDAWHSNSSMQLRAVCTTFEMACMLAEADSQETDDPFDDEDRADLVRWRQTQGRDDNYLICECDTDELDS